MEETPNQKLKIDQEFKKLIPPLSPDEYKQLEINLLKDGCREPLCIWKGYILDGHNRYEICMRYHISFKTVDIDLLNRDAAMAWICANQLGRRNITEETRKYLIGKRYGAEKAIGATNIHGYNQYVKKLVSPKMLDQPIIGGLKRRTADRLGQEYHISHATIEKYGRYAQAIDAIYQKEPTIVFRILSGQIKISHENTIELSHMPESSVEIVSQSLISEQGEPVTYKGTRQQMRDPIYNKEEQRKLPTVTIKDMPAYDPDAEIASLVLTIPSWSGSISRLRSQVNFDFISSLARNRLERQLLDLKQTVDDLLVAMKEEQDNG